MIFSPKRVNDPTIDSDETIFEEMTQEELLEEKIQEHLAEEEHELEQIREADPNRSDAK